MSTDPGQGIGECLARALEKHIADNLRARIMERVKPDIDAAVAAALAEFKTSIETYKDNVMGREVFSVLIRDQRTR
jgi:hypothetical protein